MEVVNAFEGLTPLQWDRPFLTCKAAEPVTLALRAGKNYSGIMKWWGLNYKGSQGFQDSFRAQHPLKEKKGKEHADAGSGAGACARLGQGEEARVESIVCSLCMEAPGGQLYHVLF